MGIAERVAQKLREMDLVDGDGDWDSYGESVPIIAAALDEAMHNHKSQCDAAIAQEKIDCEKALLALAGKYPTPQEGYGHNTSWAISDLCRYIAELEARRKEKG